VASLLEPHKAANSVTGALRTMLQLGRAVHKHDALGVERSHGSLHASSPLHGLQDLAARGKSFTANASAHLARNHTSSSVDSQPGSPVRSMRAAAPSSPLQVTRSGTSGAMVMYTRSRTGGADAPSSPLARSARASRSHLTGDGR